MKNIETIETYPLCWPENAPRSETRLRSAFKSQGKTIYRIRRMLRDEVRRLGGENLIISTNQRTRNDGEPVANAREPDDTGVAVYFDFAGSTRCIPCDRWARLWENLYAITKAIESMRSMDRWGVSGMLERLFTGFPALTDDAGKGWAAVLQISGDATEPQIKAAYRELMKEAHPDANGGDANANARAAEINAAYRAAMEDVSRRSEKEKAS